MGSGSTRRRREKSLHWIWEPHCTVCFWSTGEFDKHFIVSPKFDRRTKQGKADEEEFLRDVADMGITVLDAEQWRKLELMRDSAMAHPAARWMLEAPWLLRSINVLER